MSSDECDKDTAGVRKPRSGVRGFARRKKKTESITEQPVNTGFYSGCVTKCFDQIKSHTLVNEMKHALEDEGDVEDDLLLRCTRKKEVKSLPTADNFLVVSDEEVAENCPDTGNSPEKNVNTNAIKSPSPPPPPSPPKGQTKRRTRATKQKKNLLNAVEQFTKSLSDAQQELIKSQLLQNQEPEICVIDGDDEVTVRVDHRGNLLRYSICPAETFAKVIMQIAAKEDVPENQIMLVHKDKTLKPDDTPLSVGWKIADIIECHITSNLEDSLNDSCELEGQNIIELVIQSKGTKQKELVKAYINKPIASIISVYAQRVKKDPTCIQFIFDGEDLIPSQTPEMLDMEDGDILDVKEVKPNLIDDIINSKKAKMSSQAPSETIHIL